MKIAAHFFLLLPFSLLAQIRGIVVDENNKPVPYANIWVEGENKGATSEENGDFTINGTTDKMLIFSALGFETKKTKPDSTGKITLKPVAYQLDEVVVPNRKQTKEIEVGGSKQLFYLPEPQTVPWILAKKITVDPNNSDAQYVKNFIFFTKGEADDAIFRVRIFKIGKDGMPGEDLIADEIIVKTKKGKRKTIVDMLPYKIAVPKEGFVVGFESLLTAGNKYSEKAITDSKKTVYIENYGPHIMYYYSDQEISYVFRSGQWVGQGFNMFSAKKEKRVIAPAINATLTN